MSHDVWILMEESALNLLWAQAHPVNKLTPIPASALLLSRGAVRGFWNTILDSGNTYEVVNVVRSDVAEIDSFVQLHAADIFATYGWTQGNGLDNDGTNAGDYETVPQGVLDVMRDHTGSVAPTFESPNWGHVFVGQKERIFAGQFSLNFSEAFN